MLPLGKLENLEVTNFFSAFLEDLIASSACCLSSSSSTSLAGLPALESPAWRSSCRISSIHHYWRLLIIAGAILIDTKLNLHEVWRIFKPLLSPIVTPDKLELPPLRELIELCDSQGYFVKENCTTKGDLVKAELSLQLKDVLLVEEGFGHNRKAAKGQATLHLLKILEKRGISNSKRTKANTDDDFAASLSSDAAVSIPENDDTVSKSNKMNNTVWPHPEPNKGFSISSDPKGSNSDKLDIPVLPPVEMKKGGPRTALFALCRTLQWPMPTFESKERKSRSPIVFVEGSEKRTGFSSFESRITLIIPNSGPIELTGEQRAGKKSSFDSAALALLFELQRQRRILISE
ncbi:hypothetical protein ACH5RR_041067 [Cinchona calisaya]|uniref:DRBM domain-containing protein n=1 Tax=Cinchona calisaya TaxID=153742 RepID=A0ABD2XVW9_9GENT